MNIINIHCKMDNFKINNVNVEYAFTFLIHLQFKKIAIVIIQNVHLIMFSSKNLWS